MPNKQINENQDYTQQYRQVIFKLAALLLALAAVVTLVKSYLNEMGLVIIFPIIAAIIFIDYKINRCPKCNISLGWKGGFHYLIPKCPECGVTLTKG